MARNGGKARARLTRTRGRRHHGLGAAAITIGLMTSAAVGCGAAPGVSSETGSPQTSGPSTGATPSTVTTQPGGTGPSTSVSGAGGSASTASDRSTTTAGGTSSTTTTGASPASTDWQVVGTSVRGRPLRVRRIGTGPRHVLWIGGIHGNEPEGSVATAQLPDAFTKAGLGSSVTLTILEDANPDGRAANTRGNANGVDVNRNFPAQNFDAKNPEYGGTPLSQPEAKVVDSLLTSEKPALVIVMHSWANKQFINFDGPARSIAEQFSKQSGMPVEASDAIAVTPGSLGSYFGVMKGQPILTVEFARGLDRTKAWTMIEEAAITAVRG